MKLCRLCRVVVSVQQGQDESSEPWGITPLVPPEPETHTLTQEFEDVGTEKPCDLDFSPCNETYKSGRPMSLPTSPLLFAH